MLQDHLLEQTKCVLEWDRLLNVLASQAHSTMGAERCRGLSLEDTLESAQARLRETDEMQWLLGNGVTFPALTFQDLREGIERTKKNAPLESHELRDLSVMLSFTEEIKRCLRPHRAEVPTLWQISESLEDLIWVKKAINQCIDAEGGIRESATPELRQSIQEAQELKQRMRHRLENILASSRYEEILQEPYFAQRENRYVIPVKAEMQRKVPGIVHDISASGATVFLESRELVDLNNQIKVMELHIAREVRRILQEMSTMVADHVEALINNLHVLAALDCIAARARLSKMVGGRSVVLNNQGRIVVKRARHPLLVLTKEHVIANDVVIKEDIRVLVISGPNTGGKTVTLKMLGLFALMVRVGLHPPCAEGSEMAFFSELYADIGDAQDLAKDLSSFSAHMTKIIRLLEATSSRQTGPFPTSLVLLDEVVSSTDPTEGAALAEALLKRFSVLGLKVVVTTHYNTLKTLALTTSGFLNASQEFNVNTLSPTYRLIQGLPGGSSALDIAGRLGMDWTILQDACDLVNRDDRDLDRIFTNLQEKQRHLDEESAQAEKLRVEAEEFAQETQNILERLKASE